MALLHRIQLALNTVTTVNPTFTTLYTVPAGYRTVLKQLQVRNLDSSNARTCYMQFNSILVFSVALAAGGAAGSSVTQSFDLVLHPGDAIKMAGSGGTAGLGIVLSGSVYSI